MSEHPQPIAVLGGGAWGTALASNYAADNRDVMLWARDAEIVDAINNRHENPRYLHAVPLSPRLRATTDPAEALEEAAIALVVIPAQALSGLADMLDLPPQLPLISCAKGIERSTGRLPTAVLAKAFPDHPVGALSGPSFATDLASGLPTAVTVAFSDEARARDTAAMLTTPRLRCYASADVTGVEAGGSLKNVLALAAGAARGAGLGASAQAALITRGFVELRRIGEALGAMPETLMGLSGLGDLLLTCGSGQSRNFAYGEALGRGLPRDGLPLAEGVATAGIAAEIARDRQIEAPIIEAVDAILKGRLTIADAVADLMSRPLKLESE